MTRSRTILSLAAATVGLALAFAPGAFADDMSKPGAKPDAMGMPKDDSSKMAPMTDDKKMGTMSDDKMSKDTMKKDDMKK